MSTSSAPLGRFVVAAVITMLALLAILGAAHLVASLLSTTVEFAAAALLSGAFASQTVQRILASW